MGLLRNIADKLKGKKQEAIEIDYNPQEEPEGLRLYQVIFRQAIGEMWITLYCIQMQMTKTRKMTL